MSLSHEDIVAIENGLASLARGLDTGAISSIDALISEACVVVAPATRVAKGIEQVRETFRNLAVASEGLQMHSQGIEAIGAGIARDIGILSFRRKRKPEDRVSFRYVIVWHKVAGAWTLSTLVWNRGTARRDGVTQQAKARPDAASGELYGRG